MSVIFIHTIWFCIPSNKDQSETNLGINFFFLTVGEYLSSIFGYKNGMLELRREACIFCNHGPIIIPHNRFSASNSKHGFNSEGLVQNHTSSFIIPCEEDASFRKNVNGAAKSFKDKTHGSVEQQDQHGRHVQHRGLQIV